MATHCSPDLCSFRSKKRIKFSWLFHQQYSFFSLSSSCACVTASLLLFDLNLLNSKYTKLIIERGMGFPEWVRLIMIYPCNVGSVSFPWGTLTPERDVVIKMESWIIRSEGSVDRHSSWPTAGTLCILYYLHFYMTHHLPIEPVSLRSPW